MRVQFYIVLCKYFAVLEFLFSVYRYDKFSFNKAHFQRQLKGQFQQITNITTSESLSPSGMLPYRNPTIETLKKQHIFPYVVCSQIIKIQIIWMTQVIWMN